MSTLQPDRRTASRATFCVVRSSAYSPTTMSSRTADELHEVKDDVRHFHYFAFLPAGERVPEPPDARSRWAPPARRRESKLRGRARTARAMSMRVCVQSHQTSPRCRCHNAHPLTRRADRRTRAQSLAGSGACAPNRSHSSISASVRQARNFTVARKCQSLLNRLSGMRIL